jgi:tRNA (cmo5U34)-methyltransferase
MAAFFDARAAGYDAHMRGYIFNDETFAQFYGAAAAPLPVTPAPIRVLDLGCGTGLELDYIFQRAPNAHITGIDLSGAMLDLLREQYGARLSQLTLIQDSYLTLDFGRAVFDYVISVMTVHHLLPDAKTALYRRIRSALKPGGIYIEGDYVVSPADEEQFLAEYAAQIAERATSDGYYHLDIPFSLETQFRLLREADFATVELLWQAGLSAVYVARKGG